MRFVGKRAIVTGGNRGLGCSFAQGLAAEDCGVMIAEPPQVVNRTFRYLKRKCK